MWRLGPFRLDPVSFSLERDGEPVALQRRPFDLLLYLVARRDRIVLRDELLREVWGGVAVVDGAISTAVYEVRAALGDLDRPGKERWIETVRGRGFRYRGPAIAEESAQATGDGGPFVGRGRLLEMLRARLDAARRGHGGALILEGRAGVGKTRALQELTSRLEDRELRTVHCEPGAPPLWPWSQLWRSLADGSAPRQEGFWETATGAGDAPGLHFERVDSLTERLAAASQQGVCVVVVEDLHWADPSSLSIFEALAPRLDRVPVQLIGTERSQVEGEPASGLVRSSTVSRHRLDPLPTTLLYPLVEAIIGRIPSPELVGWIERHSQGIPLMVHELAERVRDAGDAVVDVPRIAQRVFAERFERLDEGPRLAMGIAALWGVRFDAPLVEAAAGKALASDRSWIREGLQTGILVGLRDHPLRFSFRHALLRDAAEGLLEATAAPGWHRRIADVIERQHPEPSGAALAQLARHSAASAVESPDVQGPLRYALLAARRAAQVLNWAEVAIHATHVLGWLELLRPGRERDSVEIEAALLRCAAIAYSSGHVEESDALLERIAPALGRVGEPMQRACDEAFRFANARCRGDYERARTAVDAIASVPGLAEVASCLRVGVEVVAGNLGAEGIDASWGDPMPADPDFHEFARRSGRDPGVDRLGFSAFALWARGDDAAAVDCAERAERWTRDSGDLRGRIWALFLLCMLHEMRRDWEALRRWAPEIDQATHRSGVSSWLGLGAGLRLWAEAREKDEPGPALRPLASILEDRGKSSSTSLTSPLLLLASRVFSWSADPMSAERAARSGLEWVETTGEGMVAPELHRQLGHVLAASQHTRDAHLSWRRALEVARDQGHRVGEARALADLDRAGVLSARDAARLQQLRES